MNRYVLLQAALPCLFGIYGFHWLIVGLRGLVSKKPFVISSRWVELATLALWAAGSLEVGISVILAGEVGLVDTALLASGIFVVVYQYLRLARNIHEVYADTDASFREGLQAALNKLGLPHEETETRELQGKGTLTVIRLPTMQADLEVEFDSRMGSGTLRMKPSRFRSVLTDIARGMNEYYKNTDAVPVNLQGSKGGLIAGAAFLVIAGLGIFPLWYR